MYVLGKPTALIDPNGMEATVNRDEYEVNIKTGDVTWRKKSKNHVLYSVDENGQRTGNSVQVSNKNILDQLIKDNNKYAGSEHYTYRSTDISGDKSGNTDDIFKLFLFCAMYTDIEWNLYRYRNEGENRYWLGSFSFETIVGPYGESHSPDASSIISNIIAQIHSHPYSERRKSLKDAFYGMGYNMDKNNYKTTSDVGNAYSGDLTYSYYVYDVTHNKIYYMNPEGIVPIEIRKVNSHKSFYFGVLNHK